MILIQKQLIDCAQQKKTVLIERKIDELNQIVQEEAKLVKQLGKLEKERTQQVDRALLNYPSLSFHQFMDTLPDDEMKKILSSKFETLRKLTIELQSINKGNEQLLTDSLSFVQHMIHSVTQPRQRHYNYQSPLNPQNTETTSRGFFDTKA